MTLSFYPHFHGVQWQTGENDVKCGIFSCLTSTATPWTSPRCCKDESVYNKWNFQFKWLKSYSSNKHIDGLTRTLLKTFADGKNLKDALPVFLFDDDAILLNRFNDLAGMSRSIALFLKHVEGYVKAEYHGPLITLKPIMSDKWRYFQAGSKNH